MSTSPPRIAPSPRHEIHHAVESPAKAPLLRSQVLVEARGIRWPAWQLYAASLTRTISPHTRSAPRARALDSQVRRLPSLSGVACDLSASTRRPRARRPTRDDLGILRMGFRRFRQPGLSRGATGGDGSLVPVWRRRGALRRDAALCPQLEVRHVAREGDHRGAPFVERARGRLYAVSGGGGALRFI